VRLLKNFSDAWHDRMLLIAEKFPELLRVHTLAPQQFLDRIYDPLATFKRLDEAGLMPGGVEEYLKACCKASPPQLAIHISKRDGIPFSEAEKKMHEVLGRKLDTEIDNNEALITCKGKRRTLRKIR
jgi:hypothetical protein